jgi:cytidine deaminase
VLPGNSYVNTVQQATIDETVFSMSSAPRNRVPCDQLLGYTTVITIELCFPCGPCRGYITRFPESSPVTSVEAESNTSTVTLRVVGGDEKGSLESETVKYGHQCHGPRTRE